MTDKKHREISRIVDSIRLVKRVHARYSRDPLKKYGITGHQLWALRIVAGTPRISLGELSDRMYLHISTASGIADRLEEKDYVARERSSKDRRVVHLRVTPRGRQVIRRVPVSGLLALMEDVGKLPSKDIRLLGEAMKILLRAMRIDGELGVGAGNCNGHGTANRTPKKE
jgi:DNA-binding MarR family transcriptional regulator